MKTGTKVGKTELRFTGLAALSRQLARDGEVWQRVQQAAVDGMIENTEDLLGEAMRRAPLDEGTLRGSGTAVVLANGKPVSRKGTRANPNPFGMGDEEYAAVSGRFGQRGQMSESHRIVTRKASGTGKLGDAVVGEVGFNTPYALTQHERLDFHHPKGGEAKYLEKPLTERSSRYTDNIAKHLQGALA